MIRCFINQFRLAWVPAQTSTLDTILATYALIVMALFRGWDYAVSHEESPPLYADTLLPIEKAAPLWVWAAAFGLSGSILLVGKWFALHRVVWLGHGIGAATYTSMMLGIVGAVTPVWMWILFGFAAACSTTIWRQWRRRRAAFAPFVVAIALSAAILMSSESGIDGIRFGTVLILPALMHWMLLIRMGWTPLSAEAAVQSVEVVKGPADAG